ncbi:MAG: ATP-grasp domain-containing protein [Wenzhouxiangellaceae bacterium]
MASKTIDLFVLGLDDFNRIKLEAVDLEEPVQFHPLLDLESVTSNPDFDVHAALDEAERQLRAFDGKVDGIIGYWDFPVSLMMPILAARLGLKAPSVDSVITCEHKYYSRLVQKRVAPANVPAFQAVDPFDDAALDAIEIDYPYWIKPVKSFASHLGFRIGNRGDLDQAIAAIRAGISELGNAFSDFMEYADLPGRVEKIDGNHCIVEALIGGRQCTLEGFASNGEVEVYGIVDSLRFPNGSTFSRYQYPTRLPRPVRARMIELARAVIAETGLDHSAFNMEFFWDRARDQVWILEINPRISQSHGDIFEKVDGSPHHRIIVELALGRKPRWTPGEGEFACAAKVFLRSFEDALVTRVPTAEEIDALKRSHPGLEVEVLVEESMRLSDLADQDQDSYSYAYAILFVGASSGKRLDERIREIKASVRFELEPVAGEGQVPAPGAGDLAGMERKNVFLVGLTPFHREKLASIRGAENYSFHGLLDEPHGYDVPGMLKQAEAELRAFDGRIDAVAGYIDFPISTMLPILCGRLGLRSPSLESLLKCEHKYWARVEQKKSVPEAIPGFAALDPFDDQALDNLALNYPFWLKPVKSSGSFLGFRIGNRKQLDRAIGVIREHIRELGEPFNFVLDQIDLPEEIARVDGNHCVAEEIIGGRQCTLEGFVHGGEVYFHGTVDSIRVPHSSSFARYEYPSALPKRIQERMAGIAARVLKHVGFDQSGFNVEFFWDEQRDRVWLLEINTRVAQHHSDLFEKVDGTSNHEVPVKLALNERPEIPKGQGEFRRAAAFFLRALGDARVTRVPSPEEIEALERRFPGTIVQPQVAAGMRLSELHEQDSYSYNLAIVYMGASSRSALHDNWAECARSLRFEFDREIEVH